MSDTSNSSTNPSDNPLINPPAQPNDAFYFDGVKTEHMLPAMEWAIAKEKAEIEAVKNNPAAPTFENTLQTLDDAGGDYLRISAIINTISSNCSTPELREAEKEIDALASTYSNEMAYDEVLFARIKAVYDNRAGMNLDAEQAKLLEDTYQSYVRRGIAFDAQKKQRLKEISVRLTELSTTFSQNTLESTAAYEKIIDNESDLDGVPDYAKDSFKAQGAKKGLTGKFLIKLQPHPGAIFTHCKNAALREEIARASASVATSGAYDNRSVVMEMVKLRDERAKILGFASHAEFVLSQRMAGNAATVHAFLKGNLAAYKPGADAHVQAVRDFALKKDGVTDLPSWDYAYYNRWLKEEAYNFKEEELLPYFSTEKVLEGMRQHAEKLFNIELRPVDGKYSTWHPDVKSYEVYDKANGKLLAIFMGDYYARPKAKSSGAWMNAIRNPGEVNGVRNVPIITNTCNFTPPTPGNPALLSIRDVETVFHEFGHALHAILGEGKYASQTGTNVKWDFVELPSQLQENWVHQKAVLDGFAHHYQTGAVLPDDLFQKMQDSENFGKAYMGLRQTSMAMLDMKWHDTDPVTITSVEDLEKDVGSLTKMFNRSAGGAISTAFGHLFAGGYSAGYYSYKWAEVLEADVFEQFEQKGLYDRATADRLRATIYSMGGRVEPMDLFIAMMGRKPDPDALYRREGILPQKPKGAPPPAAPAP